jgi:hypothetical protein
MQNGKSHPAFADDPQQQEYQREAEERWGNSDAWRQSQERIKHWTKADYERVKRDGKAFLKVLATAMDHAPGSPEAQALVAQHRAGINTFYDCTDEIYAGLADMYVADPRFAAYYDNERPGLAAFLREAMLISLGKQTA